jgi:hypothetical protein
VFVRAAVAALILIFKFGIFDQAEAFRYTEAKVLAAGNAVEAGAPLDATVVSIYDCPPESESATPLPNLPQVIVFYICVPTKGGDELFSAGNLLVVFKRVAERHWRERCFASGIDGHDHFDPPDVRCGHSDVDDGKLCNNWLAIHHRMQAKESNAQSWAVRSNKFRICEPYPVSEISQLAPRGQPQRRGEESYPERPPRGDIIPVIVECIPDASQTDLCWSDKKSIEHGAVFVGGLCAFIAWAVWCTLRNR